MSDISSNSTSSGPAGGSSQAPESVPAPEIATAPQNKGQLVKDTNPPTETEADNATIEPEANAPVDVGPNPDADPLHVTYANTSEGRSLPRRFFAIDFLIVHGVHGSWDNESLGSEPSEWVAEHAKSLKNESRILRFEYDSRQLFSGRRSREAIRKCALKLLRALYAVRQNETRTRLIMFVAHDIGGIIVKDALAAAALDRTYWNKVLDMSRIIVFIGCPHRSANSLDMEDRLSRFLFANYESGVAGTHPSTSSTAGLAAAIIEINGLFVDSKVPIRSRVISIHAGEALQGHRINQAFDSYSGTLGIPLEKRMSISDNNYSSLIDYLVNLENNLIGTTAEGHLRCERKLLSLASPVYPFQTVQSSNFLAKSAGYHAWLSHPGPQILYIHGTHRIRETAEQVFYSLDDLAAKEDDPTIVLYFSFDRRDVRCDSIRDMLSTFMAQIICNYPSMSRPLRAHCSRLHQGPSWTETDLVYWFEQFRFTSRLAHVMCVLNYFDECARGSRKLFLERFAHISGATESPWKVVITSRKPGALLNELSGPSCVALDLAASGLETNSITSVEQDMARLVKLRPELLQQDSLVREELRRIDKLDPLVRHIICEQARVRCEWPDEASIQELFGPLDLVPSADRDDHTLEQILERVLRNIPEQETLRRLLSWLLYSVRPLTIWEIATVLFFGSDHDRGGHTSPSSSVLESLIPKVETWFAGIICVDQNEVKIWHPHLRNILMGKGVTKTASGEPRFLWEKVRQTAHFDIASLCLDYLSRPSVQELLDKSYQVKDPETFETPIVADRSNLCSYAVQAWTHHFSLSSPSPELSKLLSQSVSSDLAQSWARGYWALSNRDPRTATCLETLFPIFAGLGLLDVVQPQDETDTCRGLLEAASKGQAKTVQRLLEKGEFSESALLDALVAAESSGDEKILLDLLDRITSNSTCPNGIVWPPVLIHRAAWLGLDQFAEKILELGCPADPIVKWVSSESPLYRAALNGHATTLRTLLRHNADIDIRVCTSNWAPFHIAAYQGHAVIVKVLAEEGKAGIEVPDLTDCTALYLACFWGHHRVVETMLMMGADPNMGILPDVKPGRWTPLGVASDGGFKRCVRLLLDKKANPNISGPSEIGTPLRHAAVRGFMDICGMLLDSGADPNSSLIDPPILTQVINDCPSCGNQLDMLDLLLSHNADLNAKDSNGMPVLIHAVITGSKSYAFVRRLLDHGADVNIVDSKSMGALSYAALRKRRDLVELLLEKNAEANVVNIWHKVPLYYAVANAEIVLLLLENGADPDFGGGGGFTALMRAAMFDHVDTVKQLLKHNATVDLEYSGDAQVYKGWTALYCAAWYQSPGVFRVLAGGGANMKHKSACGVPLIHIASRGNALPFMLEFPSKIDLDQVDDNGNTALHLNPPIDNFKSLISAGASLRIQNISRGDTVLSMSAYNGNMKAVECLLKHGVDINLGSPCDGAALHQACRRSDLGMMKLLVEHDANVNQRCDGLAGTPLQAACLQYASKSPRIVEEMVHYLLEHGADVSAEGGLLRFPIIAAALGGTPRLISLLIQKGARTDVRDGMGRMPIHTAAYHGIDNYQTILTNGGDINARDEMGRTALHWAAQPGRARVVEDIISRLSDKKAVDAPDIDGWTPLCWAARGTDSWPQEGLFGDLQDQIRVIRLLLENGASLSAMASVRGQKWTPLKIARFSGQPRGVIELLSRHSTHDNTSDEADEDNFKTANVQTECCDACQCVIRGFTYHCKMCFRFAFCFKCYRHRHLLHSSGHIFEQIGPEFTTDFKDESDYRSLDSDSE